MERRRFSRIPFHASAMCTQSNDSFEAELIDLSLHGLLIKTASNVQLSTDAPLSVSIHLPQSEVDITLTAMILDNQDGKLHCKVEHIDLDSVSHLKRLIELNLGDESVLERELSQLVSDND